MGTKPLKNVLVEEGVCVGFSEVRRLVSQGAVTINGAPASSAETPVGRGALVTVGKKPPIFVGL